MELKKYGPYALVTGASAGIGEEFANQLAKAGFNLVIVARRKDKLDRIAKQLHDLHNVDVKVIELDLLKSDAAEVLNDQTKSIEIGLVVLNAGVYGFSTFLDNSLESEQNLTQLNVVLPMKLAHYFGKRMATMRRGGIILVSSTAGFLGLPYAATYSASKAYILALGEALNFEMKGLGIDVLTLAPGMVKTEGSDNMRGVDVKKMATPIMLPSDVVSEALGALGKKIVVIPGLLNRATVNFTRRFLSRKAQTSLMAGFISKALNK